MKRRDFLKSCVVAMVGTIVSIASVQRMSIRKSHENYGSTKEFWERLSKQPNSLYIVELDKNVKELKDMADFFLTTIM